VPAAGLQYYRRRDYARRALWALCQPLWRLSPRWCWGWRNGLLRLFGAQIARGVRVYPSARLIQPWHVRIGRGSLISWNVTLYALGPITIGADCVISQGAHLCAGSHDPRDPAFPLLRPPIVVDNGAWIAAEAFIGPGVSLGCRAVVGARAVVCRSVPAGSIVAGNPARVIGSR
jgi:putative colanic acid biosynthesis acetyltransferase WcaF